MKTNENLIIADRVTSAIRQLDHWMQMVADGRRAIDYVEDNYAPIPDEGMRSLKRSVAQWEQDLIGNLLNYLDITDDDEHVERLVRDYFPTIPPGEYGPTDIDPDADNDDEINVAVQYVQRRISDAVVTDARIYAIGDGGRIVVVDVTTVPTMYRVTVYSPGGVEPRIEAMTEVSS